MKVVWLCLLLIDISVSLKIFDNISVNIITTDTSFSFHLLQALGTAKGFVNLITFQFHEINTQQCISGS